MPFDPGKFTALYDQLLQIDFTGTERRLRPPLASAKDVRAATAKGAPHLPLLLHLLLSPMTALRLRMRLSRTATERRRGRTQTLFGDHKT